MMEKSDNSVVAKLISSKEKRSMRKPPFLIFLFTLLGLFAVFAASGGFWAVFSHTEDPAAIKVPVYPTAVLDPKEKPVLSMRSSAMFSPKGNLLPQTMIQKDKVSIHPAMTGRSQIALVIDDMGLNRRNSQRVVALPATVTLAYLPYANDLPAQTAQAYRRGHELIVHMPMEPGDVKKNDPGPDALLTTNSVDENLRRFEKNLASFDFYIGLNNHMGSLFTTDEKNLRPVMEKIKEKGLWLLDSKTIGNSVVGKLAAQLTIPYVERDIFLDNVGTVAAVMAQLRLLEDVANKRGYAVAIGHPHDATITALGQWMGQAQKRGVEFVPLSRIIALRFPNAPLPRYAQTRRVHAIRLNSQISDRRIAGASTPD